MTRVCATDKKKVFLQIESLLTVSMRVTKSLAKLAVDKTYRRQTA